MRPLPLAGLDAELATLVAAVYASHAGLVPRIREFERAARAAGDVRHESLAKLMLADVDNRNGRRAEGIHSAYEILGGSDDRAVVAHAHAVIAGGLWRLGDNTGAVEHAYEADRLLGEGDPLCLRVDHANIFALHVNDQRMGPISHEEYRVAQRLCERLGEPDLIIANLNNWAWSCYVEGDKATALTLAQRMLYYSDEVGHPLNSSCADTIARVLFTNGQTARAAEILDDALVNAPSTDIDAIPCCLITYAEIRLAEGDVPAAVRLLESCRELTRRDGVAEMDAMALRLLSRCHAELRDFEAAYREMVEFHDAWTLRRSEQNEVLTSVTQARFALDEARRDSERFREMAEHDALTGLWNRRRSDEYLPDRIARLGPPLSVAVLDLDHFKLVNDTYSHAVGDAVLRRVGEILRTVVAPAGHAARHGGEEFLLLLDLDGPAATALCERVRTEVERAAWDEIAAGLRVTTSIGVTARTGPDDAQAVVARADACLYAAKSGGRNRVVFSGY